MTAYESIDELRQLYLSLEARIAKLEAALKAPAPAPKPSPQPQYRPPTQEEIVECEYGSPKRKRASWKAIRFAEDIAREKGDKINFSELDDWEVSDYISKNKDWYYQRKAERLRMQRDAQFCAKLTEGMK